MAHPTASKQANSAITVKVFLTIIENSSSQLREADRPVSQNPAFELSENFDGGRTRDRTLDLSRVKGTLSR